MQKVGSIFGRDIYFDTDDQELVERFKVFLFNRQQHNFTTDQAAEITQMPELLTVNEVADLFKVSKLTIKRWGAKGKLDAIRINSRGDRRYKKTEVIRILKDNGYYAR